MIDSKYGGSGVYSYRKTSRGSRSVLVAHMPEDDKFVCLGIREYV